MKAITGRSKDEIVLGTLDSSVISVIRHAYRTQPHPTKTTSTAKFIASAAGGLQPALKNPQFYESIPYCHLHPSQPRQSLYHSPDLYGYPLLEL